MQNQLASYKVAVIGAGASGLVASRELRREGHQVVVYERSNRIGGTWVYDPNIESDPSSTDPSRTIIQTSLYKSLRTNLPRESMSFHDYPFLPKHDHHRDPRRFPGHREVLLYLEDFTNEFQLRELIRFETEVVVVELIEERKWLVKSRNSDGNINEEVYSAVVICNGHYTEPRIAEIPGIDLWPGKQIHSHNYRVPDPFNDKVVVLIGDAYSGFDISREIVRVAKEVHVASRSITMATQQLGYDNLWLHSVIECAYEDGTLVFQDGSSILADVILHCTGYRYDFPFLKTIDMVTVDDNRVGPLYQHIFVPQLAPWISFIGLPWKVCPFPLYEMQSKWVAGILSRKISLPPQETMISDVEDFYSKLAAAGVPKRYTHNIMACQFDYYDWLASQCGITPEKWRNEMHKATGMNRVVRPETYRDEWDDQNLILQAHKDFVQNTPPADRVANNEVEADFSTRYTSTAAEGVV